MSIPISERKKLRTFSPVILFHDHQYVKAGSGDLEHIHIPYGDPSYGRHLDVHKKRIHEMLQSNGRYWLDIITWTRDHPESLDHSSVPSLVSSPSPPQHYPLHNHNHHHHNHSSSSTTTTFNNHYNYFSNNNNNVDSSTDGHSNSSSARKHMATTVANTTGTDNKKVSIVTSNNNSTHHSKRRRGNLPKAVTAILRDWLSRHKKHPYPTEEEKAALATETNLNLNQISNWFINARRRILQPMLEQEEEEKNELDIIMPYDMDDVYNNDTRRMTRKRSFNDVLTPTKYPPQKRMTPNSHQYHHGNHNHNHVNVNTTTTTSPIPTAAVIAKRR